MPSPAALLLNLAEAAATQSAVTGGKAANLARMFRAGLPVPSGFCLTTAAFEHFLAASGESPCAALDSLPAGGFEQAQTVAAGIRERLARTPFPEEVARQVIPAWQSLGSEIPCAVRSSATAEDLPGASFAGQHDTFLNVQGREALLEAIRRCWISLFSDRAVLYRMRRHIPHRASAMAVVMQPMVDAKAAGVIFTVDPLTGDSRHIVIEGVYGLGEALVSGRVTPDRFVLDKDTLAVVEQKVNRKGAATMPGPTGGVSLREIALDQRETACLNPAQARQLGELARQAEKLFAGPQDMEWASDASQVFLLQSRPVTVLPAAPARESRDSIIWSSANTGELFPDVVTPMSWSLVQFMVNSMIRPIFLRIGIGEGLDSWFGVIAGRIYINTSLFLGLLRGLPFPSDAGLDEVFGGDHQMAALQEQLKRVKPRLDPRALAMLARVFWWILRHGSKRQANAFLAEWRRRALEMAGTDIAILSDEQLVDFIPGSIAIACRGSEKGALGAKVIGCLGAGVGCAMMVHRLARKWLQDEDGSLANRLLFGAGGMDSAEAGLALWGLAAWAKRNPAVARVLQDTDNFADASRWLAATTQGGQFLEQWRDFMASHGHHTRGELDAHNPRWSETPDYLFHMVQAYLQASEEADPIKIQAERWTERQKLLLECQRRLRNPLKRWFFQWILDKGQRGLAARENVKSDGVRGLATIRRAILEAGQRLVQRGILASRDDVFFLYHAELLPVLSGQASFNVPATIAARKAEYDRNLALHPPSLIVGQYDPDLPGPEDAALPANTFKGLAVSPGVATGRARVILRADARERVLPGEILVAPFTDPGWTPYFLPAAAIVVDMGGQLSHGSILAREYGIPAVVNVGPATRIIRTGQWLEVDGHRGVVTILEEQKR